MSWLSYLRVYIISNIILYFLQWRAWYFSLQLWKSLLIIILSLHLKVEKWGHLVHNVFTKDILFDIWMIRGKELHRVMQTTVYEKVKQMSGQDPDAIVLESPRYWLLTCQHQNHLMKSILVYLSECNCAIVWCHMRTGPLVYSWFFHEVCIKLWIA